MGKLTDLHLRNWIAAGKPIAGKSAGDGLTFTLSKSGTAAWTLRYRHGGKQREVTLGRYPDLSLTNARREAEKTRVRVQQGVDVAAEKQARKLEDRRALRFEPLARDYLSTAKLAPKTLTQRTQQLDNDVLPKLGTRLARSVTKEDVADLVRRVAERSPAVARLVFIGIKEVLAHGVAIGALDANPCTVLRVSKLAPDTKPRKPRIMLLDSEIHATLEALPTIGTENAIAVRILLATCTRINELVRAEWPHMDLDAAVWTVPGDHAKNKTEFRIPLTPAVVELFQQLKALAGNSRYVMPMRSRPSDAEGDLPSNSSTLNAALNRLCTELVKAKKCRRFTPHDLRSTARSHLSALGVDLLVAERCLNHSLGGLVATYDKHDFFAERRDALDRWSARIAEIERGEQTKVVPFRKNAAA